MTTLKNNKKLQLFISLASGGLLLFAGYLLGETITFPKTDFWNIAEPIILVAYLLVYMAFLSLIAIFSKSNDLKLIYYPAFAVCATSVISAFIYWCVEESFLLFLFPLTLPFSVPVRAFSQALEKATTYTVTVDDGEFGSYTYDETVLYEHRVIIILFVLSVISLAVYQLYTETEEHITQKSKWHIAGPARKISLGMIFSYGGYIAFSLICSILPGGDISDTLWVIQAIISITASWLLLPLILPFALNIYLFSELQKEVKECSNKRLYFNPLVILAIILSVIGSITTLQTMLACF